MPIPSAVKTPFPIACLTVATGVAQESRAPAKEPAPVINEKLAAVQRALRPPDEPRRFPAADMLDARPVTIRIVLHEHKLRIFNGDALAIESPIAHGRSISPTPQGEFTLAGKQASPKDLNYGHLRNAAGAILARGVFAKLDPLPVGAIFDEVIPKCLLRLSEGGPVIFAGEATGAATSDGAVILPDKIAVFLFEKVPTGTRIIISP